MKIAILKTEPIQDLESMEIGFFEAEVTIPDNIFATDHDKASLVKQAIAAKLAALTLEFKTSPEMYTAYMDPLIQKHLGFPAILKFGE